MTLSTNLSSLHRDKQMFKYPTQAAESGSTRRDRSRIRAVSTRFPLKQVQNEQIVAEKRITGASQLLLHRNNKHAALQPEPAAHRSRRTAIMSLPAVVFHQPDP